MNQQPDGPISFIRDYLVGRGRRRGGLLGRFVPGPAEHPATPSPPSPPAPVAAPAPRPAGPTGSVWLPDGEPLETHSAAAREPEPDPATEREPQPDPATEREPEPHPATEREPQPDRATERERQPEPEVEPQPAQLGPDEPAPIEPDFAAPVRRAQPSQWLAEELPPVSSHSPATEDRPAPLHPERARAALRAYCRELLDPQVADEAVETILSRFDSAAAHSPATLEELLRVTRKTVAGYALAPGGWQGLVQADPEAECRATPARLVARAGDALSAASTAELERHLETCLRCQAIELRVTRAERAFATTLAARGEDDPGEWSARSSPIAIAQTAEQAGEAPGPRRRGLFGNPRRFFVAGVVGALLALVMLLVLNDTRSPGGVRASAPLGTPSSTTAPVHHGRRSRRHRPVVRRRQTHRSVARRRAPGHAVPRPGSSTASGASVSSAAPVSSAPAPAAAVSPGSGSSGSGGSGGGSGSAGAGGGSGSAGAGGGSSGSGSSGSSVSVTQQGSGLPAQNAPTQGIGTGGSSGSAH